MSFMRMPVFFLLHSACTGLWVIKIQSGSKLFKQSTVGMKVKITKTNLFPPIYHYKRQPKSSFLKTYRHLSRSPCQFRWLIVSALVWANRANRTYKDSCIAKWLPFNLTLFVVAMTENFHRHHFLMFGRMLN